MRPSNDQVEQLLQQIEAEMRRMGLWQEQRPVSGELHIETAFAQDRLTFSQWLQWVLLPRAHAITQAHGTFPERSQVGVMAIREWDTFEAADRLVGLLCELDHLINHAAEKKSTRNLWVQAEYPFVTWVADFSSLRSRPLEMVSVVEALLEAGERHQVFTPIELPKLEYVRGAIPPVTERVRARWSQEQVVDLFAFTDAAMKPGAPNSSTVAATLAWYDAADQVVEGQITDVGELLRSLEPVPGSISNGFTTPYPPLRITGPELVYDGRRAKPDKNRAACIRVAIHSDIWFPFVYGSAHPLTDYRRMFDNRKLARRHTPRLNAFLANARAMVTAAGGTWRVAEDESVLKSLLWLDDQGIRLQAPEPELMPASALDVEWS